MTAKRETVLAEIETALAAAAATFPNKAATVVRNKLVDVSSKDAFASPVVNLLDGGERILDGTVGCVLRAVGFSVRIHQSFATEAELGPAISAAHAWAIQTIMPLYRTGALANIAQRITDAGFDDPEFPDIEHARPFVGFQIDFEAEVETAEDDPET